MTTHDSPVWHPFTQHAVADPALLVARAAGAYLYTEDGRQIIDGIASWWVNTHGHCHPKIVAAVQQQAALLEQVVFAGFTHQPAEMLARELLALAGAPAARVFFSDSGSTAVEVALKMAIGFWAHRGQKRRRIVALDHGYHGDTFGTMAAGARSVFNRIYEPYLFEVTHLPFPAAGQEQVTLDALARMLEQTPHDLAALIVEPLVLGAGGMMMYKAAVLRDLAELCRRYDVLLIADEVMTGWGRTGTLFACEQAGVKPDLMCLSKGITGGFLPMGVTLATEAIYQAFYHTDRSRMFFHSSSYTGNPLACAAALAALEIWREEPVLERIATIAARHRAAAVRLGARDDVLNMRVLGTILAFEVRGTAGYTSPLGALLYRHFLARNVLLRPLGNTVYVMPPYCIGGADLERIYDAIHDTLDNLRDARAEPVL
ncbi:MAG: adenosylmethionine--8-amino-7-oxononanoate transaminase [Alphaproteobacteria bacterium]